MNLAQLKALCAVVEEKSFTRAAKVLGLSQPTITAQVQALEAHYGVPLLKRSPRAAVPTQAGEAVYRYAQKMLRLHEESVEEVAALQERVKGEARVGASTIPGSYILPPILAQFRERYPELRLTLLLGDSEEIMDRVLSGKVEIGVVGERPSHPSLEFRRWARDEIYLVVPMGHPLSERRSVELEELLSYPLIWREKGSGTRATVERNLQRAGLRPSRLNTLLELGSSEAVKQAVISGAGPSFLSHWSLLREERLKLVRLLPVKRLKIERFFFLIRLRHAPLSHASEALYEFLLSRAVISCPGP